MNDYANEYGKVVVKYARDREGFVNAIAENRLEHLPSLAFADYWDEQGLPGVAEVIRHQVGNTEEGKHVASSFVNWYHDTPVFYGTSPIEAHRKEALDEYAHTGRLGSRTQALPDWLDHNTPVVAVTEPWNTKGRTGTKGKRSVGINVLFKSEAGNKLSYGKVVPLEEAESLLDRMPGVLHADFYKHRVRNWLKGT